MLFILPTIRSLKIKFFIVSTVVIAVYLCLFYIFLEVWMIKKKNTPIAIKSVTLPYVVVHIDLKGSPPKLEYLESLLPMMKDLGVNGLMIEYEDMFPYEGKLVNLSARNCYRKPELKQFLSTAHDSGFEIIPLIQTFGHLEYALKLQEFRHLRETPVFPDSICPSKIESRTMVKYMLEQVVKFHNDISPLKYIHVGCDEVYHINKCKQCISRQLLDNDLYIDYIRYLSNIVRDITPKTTMLIWDDILRSIKPLEWEGIDCFNNVEPVYWNYGRGQAVSRVSLINYNNKFKNIWTASAFKGADGIMAAIPNLKERLWNHFKWMQTMLSFKVGIEDTFDFRGIILTGWSRYSHMDPLCELLPVAIPSLILNLLLIKRFKSGLAVDDGAILDPEILYEKYLQPEFNMYMKCPNYIVKVEDFYNQACNYESHELFNIIKHHDDICKYVAYKFNDTESNIGSVEYYSNLKLINMNWLLKNIKWCNTTLNELTDTEARMSKAMKHYFNEDVIGEYTNFKTYSTKKKLNNLLNDMYSYMYTRVWERKPIAINV